MVNVPVEVLQQHSRRVVIVYPLPHFIHGHPALPLQTVHLNISNIHFQNLSIEDLLVHTFHHSFIPEVNISLNFEASHKSAIFRMPYVCFNKKIILWTYKDCGKYYVTQADLLITDCKARDLDK